MKRWLLTLLLFTFWAAMAFAATDSVPRPSLGQRLYKWVRTFTAIDTNYIEPQHYNFTVMMQNTNTYESYRINDKDGHSILFSPEPSVKIGPYLGWHWIFLGYTVDITHLGGGSNKQDFDLSLYSNQIGIDFFWRKTGDDYKIRRMSLGEEINTDAMKNIDFDGLKASIKGFNIYYIFNHRKFSYPAAFSQSTCQKLSCGSPLLGVGYTQHSLEVDWNKLDELVERRLGSTIAVERLDSGLMFGRVRYTDFSFSGGYAYNWVFSKDWLLAVSLSAALGYKRSTGDMEHKNFSLRDFNFHNFNLDGVGRFGLVWNNTKWYAGASAILHTYNYNKSQFSTNSFFGSVNIYVGFNFGRH